MWTHDVRYKQARNNCVADMLSRPSGVPLGSAYDRPNPEDDALVDVAEIRRNPANQIISAQPQYDGETPPIASELAAVQTRAHKLSYNSLSAESITYAVKLWLNFKPNQLSRFLASS